MPLNFLKKLFGKGKQDVAHHTDPAVTQAVDSAVPVSDSAPVDAAAGTWMNTQTQNQSAAPAEAQSSPVASTPEEPSMATPSTPEVTSASSEPATPVVPSTEQATSSDQQNTPPAL